MYNIKCTTHTAYSQPLLAIIVYRKNKVTGIKQPRIIDKKGFHICNACNSDACPTIIHDAVQNVFAQAFKNAGCHVVNKPTVEDDDGKFLIPDHLILGNGTQSDQSLMNYYF